MTKKNDASSSGSLADALERARALRAKLAVSTEELNQQLASAEAMLTSLNLGVRAAVELYPGRTDHECDLLTIGKMNGKWALYVEQGAEGSDENELTPLRSSPRDIRMRVPELLPSLVLEMVRVAEEEINLVDSSSRLVRDFIADVQPKTRTPLEEAEHQQALTDNNLHTNVGPDGMVSVGAKKPPLTADDYRKHAQIVLGREAPEADASVDLIKVLQASSAAGFGHSEFEGTTVDGYLKERERQSHKRAANGKQKLLDAKRNADAHGVKK